MATLLAHLRRSTAFCAVVATLVLLCGPAAAETDTSRFDAGGYMRIMTRPDFQGGNSRLGFWNLYGRLLNEGPYAALELRLDVLEQDPLSTSPWTSIHAKIEGGSIQGADPGQGSLELFRLSQLYARTGNLLFENVTWQIGTLESYWGDLGLYDMRPAQILFETVGVSSRYENELVELLIGAGDAGYFIKGTNYNTILTVGASAKLKLGYAEVGVGGEYHYEPSVQGNPNAPHVSRFDVPQGATDETTGEPLEYENFVRGEVARRFFEEGGQEEDFARPVPVDAESFKLIGYIGFGNLGPLIWNNLFANFQRKHPSLFTTETYMGEDYRLYVEDLTDERYQLNVGNEMQLRLVPRWLDLTWAMLYGFHYDNDNAIQPTDADRLFYSVVARFQFYATETLHLLLESSLAQEQSLNGNTYRLGADSVFESTDGRQDTRGLEFGDTDTRNTWQLKVGPVLNPTGMGIFSRPSFRLLYGTQYSNVNNAFSNNFVDSLAESNQFGTQEQHWHHVVALEVETWF